MGNRSTHKPKFHQDTPVYIQLLLFQGAHCYQIPFVITNCGENLLFIEAGRILSLGEDKIIRLYMSLLAI